MLLLTIGIITVLICYSLRGEKGLLFGVLVIFIIMGFQNNGHDDFERYLNTFSYASSVGKIDAFTMDSEPLWAAMILFFSRIGSFWLFLAFLAFIEAFVLYCFIKRYCLRKYYWLAIALFYFTFNMMLLQMYVIRQSFAVSLVLLAFIFYDKYSKLVIPVLCFVSAFLIHNTSVIMIPFFVLFYLQNKNPKFMSSKGLPIGGRIKMPIILPVVFLLLYYLRRTVLSQYLPALLLLSGSDYYSYFDDTTQFGVSNAFEISPLIVLYDLVIVFVSSLYYERASKRMRVFCWIMVAHAFGDMLFFGLGSIPRILMYLAIFNLSVITSLIPFVKKRYGALFAILLVVILIGYAFKTSLPWMLGTGENQFGNFRFVFMP